MVWKIDPDAAANVMPLGKQHADALRWQCHLRTESEFSAIGQGVTNLKLGILLAFIRLDREVKSIVALGTVGLQLQSCWQAADAGALRLSRGYDRFVGQHNFKAVRAPLRARRHARVVHEVTLDNAKLTVVALDFKHVGFDGDAVDLCCHIVHGNVGRRTVLRRFSKEVGTLVRDLHELGIAAGPGERIMAFGVDNSRGPLRPFQPAVRQERPCRPLPACQWFCWSRCR